ncbi:hypothetical protein [Vibrio spartinae]|nr:hypothetical protein [Vibrio spartinae]
MQFNLLLSKDSKISMRFFLMIFMITLVGCGSTPYQDDYTKHVNLIADGYINDTNFRFTFEDLSRVDLRGLYSLNDTIKSPNMLYQGDAGLVGVIAQISARIAMVHSQRDDKLAKEQEKANEQIQPLRKIADELSLTDMVGDYHAYLVNAEEADRKTINIKPIFFSNSDMTNVSIKSIVWLSSSDRHKSRRYGIKYRNLIQVYSQTFTESQTKNLIDGNGEFLSQVLSSLLRMTLYVVKNELMGKYSEIKNPDQNFLIKDNSGVKVVRGSAVDNRCGYRIIQDIHSWFIAYPEAEALSQNKATIPSC